MADTGLSGIFHLPPGADFASAFVGGLSRRMAAHPPEAMARVTVWLNSERMRRRVTEALVAAGPGYLPRLKLIAELASEPVLEDLPPPEPSLSRLLVLSRLVEGLLDKEPDLAPREAVFDLAASLSDLIDEMQAEGATPQALSCIDMGEFAAYWQQAQKFIGILAPFFDAAAPTSPGARARLAAERLGRIWAETPPPHPVIVAGSTGSRGPAFLLMRAVGGLSNGTVVLPGFDDALGQGVRDALDRDAGAEDHPQYRLHRFLKSMGNTPPAVEPWLNVPVPLARNQVLSLALHPAPVTDEWLSVGAGLSDLPQRLSGLSLLQAETPRDEAEAIAACLRDAVERGIPSALISPDRALTRRVTSALDRWGIRPDDSAGRPLALSPPGRFLRQVAALFAWPLRADRLVDILKHPLAFSGEDRGDHLRATREMELALRRSGPAFPGPEDLRTFGTNLNLPDWGAALAAAFDGLPVVGRQPLSAWVARHHATAEALARGTDRQGSGALWDQDAGRKALTLMAELAQVADRGGDLTATDYARLFETVIHQEGRDLREDAAVHPLVSILGPREARESGARRVILAGLNEGIWPRLPVADPWMNRRMRGLAGLLLPERQIGLAAHDFQQGIGAEEVILSRALRDSDAETVPSRWLNRLTNLLSGLPEQGGKAALAAMQDRGQCWLDLSRRLARPTSTHLADPALAPAPRPAPSPPLAHRLRQISLSRISDLIRDPYSVYARDILRLRPLDPLRPTAEPRDRGTILHRVMERFLKERAGDEPRTAAEARLMAIAEEELGKVDFPAQRAIWTARFAKVAGELVAQEARRESCPAQTEITGDWTLPDFGFRLFGRLDRADFLPDGRAVLYDWKSGALPSNLQETHFDKQLVLSALVAEAGGFAALGPVEVAAVEYLSLSNPDKPKPIEITPAVLASAEEDLRRLITRYRRRSQGYVARRSVMKADEARDHDHLARFGEWQMTDRATVIPVGGDDDAG